jgi:hypothetical protein
MIFLQKPDRPHDKPFLWQAGSQDIFAKTDRQLAKPFLWQAGSHDIFAKT